MAKKVISCSLDPSSIDAAIKAIEAYKAELEKKLETFRQLIAMRVAWRASEGFSTALTSDIFMGGEPEANNVSVSVDERNNVSVVIADGEQAVFIEFGAGVYYNGSAGSSPHPYSSNNPSFTIGSYGKGYGKKKAWALPKEMWEETNSDGKPIPMLTRGTPAAMPMYHGVQAALSVINRLAEEVFGK